MSNAKKIVLLGHFGVGKSSLIRRFVEDKFSNDYKVTIGVHIFKKELELDNKKEINLIIWDIEGHDDYKQLRKSYLLGSSGFIYVFDITRSLTNTDLQGELNHIKQDNSDVPILVVANKIDLLAADVLKQRIEDFDSFVDYYVSAKTGDTVQNIFHKLADTIFLNTESNAE